MTKRGYNRTLLQIFLTLLFITCIMFVFNYLVFKNSVSTMNEQISQNNRLMARSIIHEFDRCFEEISTRVYDLNFLNIELFDRYGYQNMDMVNVRHLINTASSFFSQSYVEDFAIFYDYSELAITGKGTENFSITINKRYKNGKYASEFWKNFAAIKHPPIIIPSDVYTDISQIGTIYNRKILAIVGNNQTTVTHLNIIVFISEDKLLSYVNRQNLLNDSTLIVLDQNKNVIINTGEPNDFDNLNKLYFGSENEASLKKDRFEYFSVKSSYNDFIYIYRIPNSLNVAFNAISFNQIVLFATMLTGMIISILFSLFLYKPIKNTLDLISSRYIKPGYNKFEQIHYGIEMMQKENELIINQIETAEDDIIRSIFIKMIDDVPYYKNTQKEALTYFRNIFDCKYFFMLSFYIDPCSENETASNNITAEEVSFALKKVIVHCFEKSIVFHYKSMQFIALIGISKKTKREDILLIVRNIVDSLKADIFKDYCIITAVSKFYTQVEECEKAFNDLKTCMAYRTVKSSKNIIDVVEIDNTNDMNFPIHTVEKLFNYLLTGNSEEGINVINKLINNIIDNNISYMKFTYIAIEVFNNIINVMIISKFDKSEIIKLETEFWEIILNGENCEKIRAFFKDIIENMTEKLDYNNNQSKLNKEFIIQYINLHYAEDLYLEKMADVVGTSSKYFSNFFKKAFGISFIDYLNKVRIYHAREYLKNTDIPISELSNKLGYIHSRTFTSTFKKYSGIPPTEYRKQYRQE